MSDDSVDRLRALKIHGVLSSKIQDALREVHETLAPYKTALVIPDSFVDSLRPMQDAAERMRLLQEEFALVYLRFAGHGIADKVVLPSFRVNATLNLPIVNVASEVFADHFKRCLEESRGKVEEPRIIDVGVFREEPTVGEIIKVSGITDELLRALARDPQELCRLSPDQFEELIMDRLSKMGYAVFRAGNINQPDGGVDMIFKSTSGLPILGVVQVKHHSKPEIKTGVEVVHNLHGVLQFHRPQFSTGLVVTNTSFTGEAQWVAKPLELYLRLRDKHDVHRWVKGEFNTPEEERELPSNIQLTSKLTIPIKKQ